MTSVPRVLTSESRGSDSEYPGSPSLRLKSIVPWVLKDGVPYPTFGDETRSPVPS